MTKIKNIILIALSAIIIFSGAIYLEIKTPDEYSLSERRTLNKRPEIKFENMLSGKFMTDFEDFTLDQFPLRDTFRRVKAVSSLYVFRQKANHDLYTIKGYLSKLEYPENTELVNKSLTKLQDIYGEYIKDTDCNMYLTIIPDKNYFLAPMGGYPTMDYDALTEKIKSELDFAEYIDIFPLLELSDYYYTDQHWRQEKIVDVADKLASAMGTQINTDFKENELDTPLYGAYVGQSALKFEGDKVIYLTDDATDSCTVKNYSTGKAEDGVVYDLKKAQGKDAYELYLSGAQPFMTIENPNATTDKELVIFRDSFSSSLTPLLISGYSKITVIDLRYMKSDLIKSFMTFDKQDVIYLYSTLIFNNSLSM